MSDPINMDSLQQSLAELKPAHRFAICFDSDGCVFDVMTVKHQQAFGPAWVEKFGLHHVRDAALEVWDFVNLFSKTRGTNRFRALKLALDVMATHPAMCEGSTDLPEMPELNRWVNREKKLGEPSLKQAIEETGSDDLKQVLDWHHEVNRRVSEMKTEGTLFAGAADGVMAAAKEADIFVVSNAPHATLQHEWGQAGLAGHTRFILGQEFGPKESQLDAVIANRYDSEDVLMVGDAPGDATAAAKANCWFYPILPGKEPESWRVFLDEALPRLVEARFDEGYQQSLFDAFGQALPESPPWQN